MDIRSIPIPDAANIVKRLIQTGWLNTGDTIMGAVKALLAGGLDNIMNAYAVRFQLGDPRQIIEHLNLPRFCGRHDVENITLELAGSPLIPSREIRWYAKSFDLPGLSWEVFSNAVDASWKRLAAVCGIRVRNVGTPEEANTIVSCGPIDGAMGTLAWSELANGTEGPANQMYDSGDSWILQDGVLQPSNKLDIGRVLDHENIHRLGLPHDTRNFGALMDPIYSVTVDRVTKWDVERLQRIYGPPLSVTKPTGGDTPANPPAPPPEPVWVPTSAFYQWGPDGLILRLPNISVKAKQEG